MPKKDKEKDVEGGGKDPNEPKDDESLWKTVKIPPVNESDTWKIGYARKNEEGKQEVIVGVDDILVYMLNKLEKISAAIVGKDD